MEIFMPLLVGLMVLGEVFGRETCEHVYFQGKNTSGFYTMSDGANNYQVYCEFAGLRGFTYLPKEALATGSELIHNHLPVEAINTDKTRAKIRFRKLSDGSQYETLMEQLPLYSDLDLKVSVNSHTGYKGSTQDLGPFVFLGFLDLSHTSSISGSQNGFKTNGDAETFTNCDTNTNSYFTFYTNPTNSLGRTDAEDPSASIIGRWRSSAVAVPVEEYLPENYFMDVEAHWGGCGGFEWTKRWAEPTQFALGIGFNVEPRICDPCSGMGELCLTTSPSWSCSCSETKDGNYFQEAQADSKLNTADVEVSTVPSHRCRTPVSCATKCHAKSGCTYFSFSTAECVCELYTVAQYCIDPALVVNADGFRLYKIMNPLGYP